MPETLNQIRNRPRFKLVTTLSQEEYVERLRQFYKENRKDFSANINTERQPSKYAPKKMNIGNQDYL